MRQAVIMAHPSGRSFNAAVARAYAEELRSMGHEPVSRNLYALDFDPRLRARELPWADDFQPGSDIIAERDLLETVSVFVLVYPLWFNAPPAMMKGYVERVFGIGFGYGRAGGASEPRLRGRTLMSFTTSGAPETWAEQTGALPGLRHAFDDYLAEVCGLTVLEHRHFGGVVPGLRPDAARAMLDEVRAIAARRFNRSESLGALAGDQLKEEHQ
jgi:NAD(P)H dehydrogenase (quinone)